MMFYGSDVIAVFLYKPKRRTRKQILLTFFSLNTYHKEKTNEKQNMKMEKEKKNSKHKTAQFIHIFI